MTTTQSHGKPITFWVQTPEVEVLVGKFGDWFERLHISQKLYLAHVLTAAIANKTPMQLLENPNSYLTWETEDAELLSSLSLISEHSREQWLNLSIAILNQVQLHTS
ncbi:MAG TPA: hypothetical protein V6C65_04545 [Allocoleopsis sp.]